MTTGHLFTQAINESRGSGTHSHEGCGWVSVYGPPAGPDGYRQRNVTLLRSRIFEANRDREAAKLAGDENSARVLGQVIEGWRRSLASLGAAA